MTGCSAKNCKNRSTDGFRMYRFPKDARLKLWLKNIGRNDWIPGSSAMLCHEHFSKECWEVKGDGKIKLKNIAIPTVFCNVENENILNQNTVSESNEAIGNLSCNNETGNNKTEIHENMKLDESFAEFSSYNKSIYDNTEEINYSEIIAGNSHEDEPNVSVSAEGEFQGSGLLKVLQACIMEQKKTERRLLLDLKKNNERLQKLEKLYDKAEKSKIRMFKELKAAKEKIKKLERYQSTKKIHPGLRNYAYFGYK